MNLENKLLKYKSKLSLKRPSEDAKQYVYRILSTLILNMILIPGQRMNEQQLASFMNVSRTPLHDTFIKLSNNNLIDIVPMRGSFVLNEILIQLKHNYTNGDFFRASRSLAQFYHQIFILGGGFEILWSKLYEYESDLFRLYSLAFRDLKLSTDIYQSLSSITNALIHRDNDLACQLFSQHMSNMLNIVDLLITDNLNVSESLPSA